MERKNYEDLTFTDSFMFNKVMLDKVICKEVLSLLLGHDVGPLEDIRQEEAIQATAGSKPIRLDIFTKDDDGYYDAEMQNKNNRSIEALALPLRSRYYQSMIDIEALDKNCNFRELKDSNIIFICTFDPFGLGLPVYTFKSLCEEDTSFCLGDGYTKYFFNVTANVKSIPDSLKAFFKYVTTKETTDKLTDMIEAAVESCRNDDKWRSEYMRINMIELDAREEGREEGRAEEYAKTAAAIAERDAALAERDIATAELDAATAELDAATAEIKRLQEELAKYKKN